MTRNTIYPGRPNYIGPTKGAFAFVHHKVLSEWSDNIKERIAYIRSDKPKHERKSRLYHLLYLDIPELAKAYKDLDKACEDRDKAWEDWTKVREDLDKAHKDRDKARKDWYKAREDLDKAYKDLDKAYKDWDKATKNYKPKTLAYVNKHIPDHKWDGKELRFK